VAWLTSDVSSTSFSVAKGTAPKDTTHCSLVIEPYLPADSDTHKSTVPTVHMNSPICSIICSVTEHSCVVGIVDKFHQNQMKTDKDETISVKLMEDSRQLAQ